MGGTSGRVRADGGDMTWFLLAPPGSATMRGRLAAAGLRDAGGAPPGGEPGVVVVGDAGAGCDPAWFVGAPGRVLVAVAPGAAVDPWVLLACGAADVVRLDGEDLRPVLDRLARWDDVDALVGAEQARAGVVGGSARWRLFLRDLVEVARWSAAPVLLVGETGAGKEVAAGIVHRVDPRRREHALVLLDCTTVVPTLAGSEFFGHERGAFTGATTAHEGAFSRVDGGTLFLDEVGELPAELQAALLRVVQEGTYQPVGGSRRRRTDFRLVAATNRDLRAGGFRTDLYHRLAATTLRVPALRERPDDVLPLFRHFLAEQRAADRHGARRPGAEVPDGPEVAPEVAEALRVRDWPGNVRELRQLAARVSARHVGGGPVTPGDLPPEDRPAPSAPVETGPAPGAPTWERQLDVAVRAALRAGLGLQELKARTADVATRVALEPGGDKAAAARLLGVSRRALDYRSAALDRDQRDGPSSEASS